MHSGRDKRATRLRLFQAVQRHHRLAQRGQRVLHARRHDVRRHVALDSPRGIALAREPVAGVRHRTSHTERAAPPHTHTPADSPPSQA